MSDRATYNRIQRLAEIAGVTPQTVGDGTGDPSDVTPHTLRHSLACRVLQVEEGRLKEVQARLRHQTLTTTNRVYSHIVPR